MRIKYFLKALFCSGTWLQNHPYNETWDKRLNELMAAHKFLPLDEYTVRLGPVILWVGNHPYCSFHQYRPIKMAIRPSRATILYAHDKMIGDIIDAQIGGKEL